MFNVDRFQSQYGIDLMEMMKTLRAGYGDGFYQAQNFVLYVDRQFAGKAGVTVTAAGLTTSNQSYKTQLDKAIVGDPYKPFPCLWSANIAAKQLVAATGMPVTIKVASGNSYTIGSVDNTQNGSYDGNTAVAEEADIKVANIAADLLALSLGQNKVTYEFGFNTTIYNICKSFTIYLINLASTTAEWKTRMLGKVKLIWVYGEPQGITAHIVNAQNIALLDMVFEADTVLCNQYKTVAITDYQRVVVNIKKLYTYDCQFEVYSTDDWETAGRKKPYLEVNIGEWLRGSYYTAGMGLAGSDVDFWAAFVLTSWYGANIVVNVKTLRVAPYGHSGSTFLRSVATGVMKNVNLVFNVDYAEYKVRGSLNNLGNVSFCCNAGAATNVNNHLSISIKELYTEYTFGHYYNAHGLMFGCVDSSVTYNIGHWTHNSPYGYHAFNAIADDTATDANNHVLLNVGVLVNKSANPIIRSQAYGGANSNSRVHIFKGVFIQNAAGQKVIDLTNANPIYGFSVLDSVLKNDGTVPCIDAGGAFSVLVKDVQANAAVGANITPVGGSVVNVPTLGNYFK